MLGWRNRGWPRPALAALILCLVAGWSAGASGQGAPSVIVTPADCIADPAARLRCTWRVGAPRPVARPGELAHFLTERYVLFTCDQRGRVLGGRVWHERWPLRDAELVELEDGLVAAAGVTLDGHTAPVLYHTDELDVVAGALHRA